MLFLQKNFPLLSVGWYLFRVVSGNRYLPTSSNENVLYITSNVMYLLPDGLISVKFIKKEL